MLDELTAIATELRCLGIPVSVAQQIDAGRALTAIDPLDAAEVYAALSTTLTKRDEHLPALRTVLDIFLGSQSAEHASIGSFDDEGLRAMLPPALLHFDTHTLRLIAREAVLRHSGFAPGRPVGGTYYVTRTLRWLDLPAVEAAIAKRATSGVDGLIAADRALRRERFVREAVDSAVRALLVADRGVGELARLRRAPLIGEIEFMHANSGELKQLNRAILPVARSLARRFQQRSRRRVGPDLRRIIRKAMAHGGAIIDIDQKVKGSHPPPLVVFADVSSSVASFAYFTLSLMHGLSQTFPAARYFAFIDDIVDVTADIAVSSGVEMLASRLGDRSDLMRADGHSDYGHSFCAFLDRWPGILTDRSIVLVLGDGRNNNRSPEEQCFATIARRAQTVYWLNPEGQENWTSGDSAIPRYRSFCDAIVECRNLTQLQRFVAKLAS